MNPCKGCQYYRSLGNMYGMKGCHYCYDTGVSRGCPPEECGKQGKRKEGRKKKVQLVVAAWKSKV